MFFKGFPYDCQLTMRSTLPLRHQSPSHPQIMLHFLHSRNLVSVSILRLLHQGCGVCWCVLDSAWPEHCNTFWCVTLELCQPGGRGKPLWGAVWSAAHHQVNQYYVLYLHSTESHNICVTHPPSFSWNLGTSQPWHYKVICTGNLSIMSSRLWNQFTTEH